MEDRERNGRRARRHKKDKEDRALKRDETAVTEVILLYIQKR